jgi:hypothetical protein
MTISAADSRAMLDLARRAAIEAGSMAIQTPARTLLASTKSSPTRLRDRDGPCCGATDHGDHPRRPAG